MFTKWSSVNEFLIYFLHVLWDVCSTQRCIRLDPIQFDSIGYRMLRWWTHANRCYWQLHRNIWLNLVKSFRENRSPNSGGQFSAWESGFTYKMIIKTPEYADQNRILAKCDYVFYFGWFFPLLPVQKEGLSLWECLQYKCTENGKIIGVIFGRMTFICSFDLVFRWCANGNKFALKRRTNTKCNPFAQFHR